jgi:hypothetical protein
VFPQNWCPRTTQYMCLLYGHCRRRDTMAPAPPLPVTEDTPPDMLAGSMDLRVVLPNGNSVKMSVERRCVKIDFYCYGPFPDMG